MKSAAEKIYDILIASGMSESEVYSLMVQFLEEEAELYVECLDIFKGILQGENKDENNETYH